jgi:hypothetical protein
LKTASWFLSLLLAGLLIYSFAQVPSENSQLSVHVSGRYQQRAQMETGIPSRTLAVLADYRSLDLFATAFLFLTAALGFLFVFSDPPRPLFPWFPLFNLGLGVLLVMGVGLCGLEGGGNFLDYEGLARWFIPTQARLAGALTLLAGALFSFGGFITLWVRWARSSEGPGGR